MHSTLPPIVRAPGEGRFVSVPGARITFTAIAAETGGRFELYEVMYEPQRSPAELHVHQQMDELIRVTHGEIEVALGDRMIIARTGSTVFIPRGTTHAIINHGPAPATTLMQWSPSGHRDQYFERLAKLTSGPMAPPRTQLVDLGRRFDEHPA